MRDIDYNVHLLVARHRGAIPVILTAPHGGEEQPPGVEKPRTGAGLPPDCRFKTKSDRFTRTIIRGVAQTLFDVFAEEPYVVFANFDRKFIDANRSRQCAFEDPEAAKFYDEYHNTIRGFVDEVRVDNGGVGVIFVIYRTDGVSSDSAHTYLGTLHVHAVFPPFYPEPPSLS